jgi:PPP family 3-phenylpropionic acid transporter
MPQSPSTLKPDPSDAPHWAVALGSTYVCVLAVAFFWTYLPRYFVTVGWTSAGIGFVLGAAMIVRSVAQPTWARIAERAESAGAVLRVVSTLGAAALWTLPFVTSDVGVYLSIGLIYATWNSFLPMVDALTVRQLGSGSFGRIRAWGSAGFGVAALAVAVAGADNDHATIAGWAPWVIAIIGTVGALSVWSTPRREFRTRSPGLAEAMRLLRRPALFWLFPIWALHWASQAPFNLFLVFLAEDRGMSGWVPGVAVALGIVGEVIVLAIGSKIVSRLGPELLFAACAAVTAARWFVSSSTGSELVLVAVQFSHGLTFGGLLLTAMAVLDREVRPDVRHTGQALLYVVVFGAGSAIGNSLAGYMDDAFGAATAFQAAGWLEVGVALAATIYALTQKAPDRSIRGSSDT